MPSLFPDDISALLRKASAGTKGPMGGALKQRKEKKRKSIGKRPH